MKPEPPPAAEASSWIARKPADPREAAPSSFHGLRSEAIARVQAASGDIWTDYNLHDPGVTVLEQVCYAMTDLVVRSGRDVAEHLAGAAQEIDFQNAALLLPRDVLPARAGTATDYRRWLLDSVPKLDDVRVTARAPHGGIGGLQRMQVKLAIDAQPAEQEDVVRQARQAWWKQRTLAEDLDDEVLVVQRRRCHLRARLEVGGARSAAAIVAEVYLVCARHVADRLQAATVAEWVAQGRSIESMLTGPAPERACYDEASARAEPRQVLSVGELGQRILRIEGVRDVGNLAVLPEGETAGGTRLAWRGDGWALSLLTPGQEGYTRGVQVRRGAREETVTADDLQAEFEALRLLATTPGHAKADLEALLPRPRPVRGPEDQGRPQAGAGWMSVQEQFPPAYGLGREGLSVHAGVPQRARLRQMQAYLALFDQLMANGAAQIDHLRELFSLAAHAPTYWWAALDEDSAPGIDALLTAPREDIEARVFASHDQARGRRQRVLDVLLALYGQTYRQNALRASLSHLDGDELEQRLLENKRAFLAQVAAVSLDRGAGHDIGQPHWDLPKNTSGLQRYASLLLGFRRTTARSLLGGLRRAGIRLADGATGPMGAALELDEVQRQALRPVAVVEPQPAPRGDEPEREAPAWLVAGGDWPANLLSAGAVRSNYRLRPLGSGAACELVLQADGAGRRWWKVGGPYRDAGTAARAAAAIRRRLLALGDDGEGMHVIEHVLLRPRGDGVGHERFGLPPSWYTLRVTVVLPDWPARGRDERFRSLARETVALNCPAHVLPECVWLDQRAMAVLEQRLQAWLDALRQHALAGAPKGRASTLDAASCAVLEVLPSARSAP